MEVLHPDFRELREADIEPEIEILSRLIAFFGPVPPELVAHINDERWGNILMELSEAMAEGGPGTRFEQWEQESFPNLGPETKRVIARMTNLDPAARATIFQVLEDRWWSQVEHLE